MQFPGLEHYYTGVLVPVLSLRTAGSAGSGEFADLVPLADWCRACGLNIIQVLPLNDTGFDSSPYSAVSAFGLNPIYVRLGQLPELRASANRARHEERTGALRAAHADRPRVAYQEVLAVKLEILRELFSEQRETLLRDAELGDWVRENPWVRQYAAYKALKDRHGGRAWSQWDSMRDPRLDEIDAFWDRNGSSHELWYYAWIQWRLEQQLREAVSAVSERGVSLKGDLPILMNEDSADVWAHRDIFIPELRAGAPPDMFSELGQNWNFPVYDWDRLGEQDYDWWKRRLRQADKFYHAYRIDHVLGFFRIWAIPHHDVSGTMGYFYPSALLGEAELAGAGFDSARVRWLARPHVSRDALEAAFGNRTELAIKHCFEQIDGESLYVFAEHIRGERDILLCPLEDAEHGTLLDWYRDRALREVSPGLYAPMWDFQRCSRYEDLSDDEKARFETMSRDAYRRSEEMWEEQGRRLLSFMNSTVPMLTCAEDLGVIPESVPRTLSELGILGMRVPRWAREWDEPGQPFIPPQDYPFLTVCAPSVHDTSTLREWWENEGPVQEFWEALGLEGTAPGTYSAEVARQVAGALLETGSAICMFQIQDLFALEPSLVHTDPADDRVNVPGTYNAWNWCYRIPVSVEELLERTDLNRTVHDLVSERRRRPQ